jgi:hypothetical protein
MKALSTVAAVATLALSIAAFAQDKSAPQKPGAKAEAAKPDKVATERKMPNPRRWHEDARQCLGKSSNSEIIKCAEAFL